METKGTSQYRVSDEESVYGADHSAFYVGQGKDPRDPSTQIHSAYYQEGRKRRRRCACLCVGLRAYTWMCVAYNLFVNIVFSAFCWGLFTALIALGGALLPLCVGVVVFLGTLQAARWFAQAEIAIVNAFSHPDESRAYRPSDALNQENFKGWAVAVGCTGQSYIDLLCLWLIKFPLALTSFLLSGVLIGLSGAAMSAPLVFLTCDVCMKDGNLCFGTSQGGWNTDATCDGWRVNTFGDTIGLAVLGVLLFVLTLHINCGLASLSVKLSRAMLSYQNRSESSARLIGAQAGAHAYCACPSATPSTAVVAHAGTNFVGSSSV